MISEKGVRQAAARRQPRNTLFERYAWYFMRVSGLILLVIAVFHLIYMHFLVPGGIAGIDHALVIARWTDPEWGTLWRTFDLLLLAFGLTHGSNGIRYLLDDYIRKERWLITAKIALTLGYIVLLVMGMVIIFNANSHAHPS